MSELHIIPSIIFLELFLSPNSVLRKLQTELPDIPLRYISIALSDPPDSCAFTFSPALFQKHVFAIEALKPSSFGRT